MILSDGRSSFRIPPQCPLGWKAETGPKRGSARRHLAGQAGRAGAREYVMPQSITHTTGEIESPIGRITCDAWEIFVPAETTAVPVVARRVLPPRALSTSKAWPKPVKHSSPRGSRRET